MDYLKKPHNNFFQTVFSHQGIMEDLISQLLPDLAQFLHLETLKLDKTSYIDEDLQDTYSDIVYDCELKNGHHSKIALLFEHKSYQPKHPKFQLLDYMRGSYRLNIQNKEPLALVPIIFYHGKTAWKYKRMADYFKNLPEGMEVYLPDFKYELIDLTQYSDEFILALRTSFLINALIALKHSFENQYILKHAERLFYNVEFLENTELGISLIHTLVVYTMNVTKIKKSIMDKYIEETKLSETSKERVKTTAENYIDYGIEQGIEQGTERGLEKRDLEIVIEMVKYNQDDEFIIQFGKVSKEVLKHIRPAVLAELKEEKANIVMAKSVISHYKNLFDKDIAEFCQLEIEIIRQLKKDAE